MSTPAGLLRAPDLTVDSATGVAVHFAVAAPGGRMVAFLIDWGIRLVLAFAWYAVAAMIYNGAPRLAAPLEADAGWFGGVLLPAAAMYALYHPILEIAMRGRTPGKRMSGIRIVTLSGAAPGAGVLVLRNVFRLIDGFPGVYAVGLVATFVTRNHVRIGDLAAGTLLVYEQLVPAPAAAAGGATGPDPEAFEIVTELEARWTSLAPEARLRLGRALAARLAPERSWESAGEEDLRGALALLRSRALRSSHDALPERDASLRRALLEHAELWSAARARFARLGTDHADDVHETLRALEDYRLLARDLAIARRLLPHGRAREYLEAVYAEAHHFVHRRAVHPVHAARSLFRDQIPEIVGRLRLHIFWTALLFLLSMCAGGWLVNTSPDLVALFASPEMIATVERGELWTDDLLNIVPSSVLSIQLLTNNIIVSLFAYCAGFLFGLGTFYIVGLNGFMLGGIFAFTAHHGLGQRLFEFVVAHGLVELSCLVLAGAAGAAVGEALVRPRDISRTRAFSTAARDSSRLLVAIAVLLLGCGFIEGYVSPDPEVPLATRLIVGVGYFLLMIALLRGWLFGRSRSTVALPA